MAGESCQFGYINVGKFVDPLSGINYSQLEKLIRLMTRVLDNALEFSIEHYAHPLNQQVMRAKRKIGVGICGLADMLLQLRLPYSDLRSRRVAKDVIAFINYVSKLESHELAKQRGSFGAMGFVSGCRYNDNPGFLEEKYGSLETRTVTPIMWRDLASKIRDTRLLRNASTVALPPTGRSGLVIDASTGIEPIFSLVGYGGEINPYLKRELDKRRLLNEALCRQIFGLGRVGSMGGVPHDIKAVYQTALEIEPQEHLLMAGEIEKAVDESIAKTVNIPGASTTDDVVKIYLQAYKLRLKGITIFRTGSRKIQPRKLANL